MPSLSSRLKHKSQDVDTNAALFVESLLLHLYKKLVFFIGIQLTVPTVVSQLDSRESIFTTTPNRYDDTRGDFPVFITQIPSLTCWRQTL